MRSGTERAVASMPPIVAVVLACAPSHAETDRPAGGRIDGDTTLGLGAGCVIATGGPSVEADIRVRYLDSAGLFATYEDSRLIGAAGEPLRLLGAGFEIRPLFLARWLQGLETGSARVDLAIDSLGIEIGGLLYQPAGGSLGSRSGLELGLGVELPVLTTATGPWIGIHGGVRWSEAALAGDLVQGPDDRSFYIALTVAWHQVVGAHLIDMGDGLPK
jgi:hypothetical protein